MEREIVSLVASIALIIVLVRLRVDLGVSMFAGAACLSLVVGKGPVWTAVELVRGALESDTLLLLARVATIIALGTLAGRLGYLDRFVSGLRKLIGDNRIVIALMPAFGGLLPMPGGAMLTAPMVQGAASKGSATPEERFFVNYWFRHVWEYVWPLYPGLVVAAALVDRSMGDLFRANYPLTLAAIAGGVIFVLRKVDAGTNVRVPGEAGIGWRDLLHGIWPFIVVIGGVLVLNIELVFVVLFVLVVLILLERAGPRDLGRALREGARFQIITLVLGVGAYKYLLAQAGIIEAVPPFFMRLHMPELLVLCAVPMIVGLITGVTLAFIAVTFPILIPLMGGSDLDTTLVMFAFASGFVGCLLSPVHLCLVLSREYFHASLGRSFRMLLLPALTIMAVATALVLL